ncbi:hypothetical protein DENSPDRAFT_847434 [Dentipellis sp. KUC8613]|nr:hypothetical protein DENSPDRAFT_847434 [Dentipellis sp. KUC8613]
MSKQVERSFSYNVEAHRRCLKFYIETWKRRPVYAFLEYFWMPRFPGWFHGRLSNAARRGTIMPPTITYQRNHLKYFQFKQQPHRYSTCWYEVFHAARPMKGANAVDLTSSPPLPAPTTTRALAPRAARGRTRSLASASAPVSASSSRHSSVLSVRSRSLPIQAVHERRDRQSGGAAQAVTTREHAAQSNISAGNMPGGRGNVKRLREQGGSNASGAEQTGETSRKKRRVDAETSAGAEIVSHGETSSSRDSDRMAVDPSPSAPAISQAVPHQAPPGPIEHDVASYGDHPMVLTFLSLRWVIAVALGPKHTLATSIRSQECLIASFLGIGPFL